MRDAVIRSANDADDENNINDGWIRLDGDWKRCAKLLRKMNVYGKENSIYIYIYFRSMRHGTSLIRRIVHCWKDFQSSNFQTIAGKM